MHWLMMCDIVPHVATEIESSRYLEIARAIAFEMQIHSNRLLS